MYEKWKHIFMWLNISRTFLESLATTTVTNVKLPPRFPPDEIKSQLSRAGLCNWCKRGSALQDFTSTIEGREIYCSGLCSEKCFIEAAKQICSVENGTQKPRYVSPAPKTATVVKSSNIEELRTGMRHSSCSSPQLLVPPSNAAARPPSRPSSSSPRNIQQQNSKCSDFVGISISKDLVYGINFEAG